MKYVLSEEEIAYYRENGFLVIEDFLDPDELEEWRCAVDKAVLSRGEDVLQNDPRHFSNQNVFKQRLQLWMDNDRIKDLILDERIGKMAADLEGVDGIRIWHDQALIKMPWETRHLGIKTIRNGRSLPIMLFRYGLRLMTRLHTTDACIFFRERRKSA